MVFENVLVVDPVDGEYAGIVEVTRGFISGVRRRAGCPDCELLLLPGFVDLHTHGSKGVDSLSMDEKGLKKWEEFLYSQGVTYFLPTTMSAQPESLISSAKVVERYLESNSLTSVGGIHYEGPYLSLRRKGAQNPSLIREIDLQEVDSTLNGTIKLLTMAPELRGFREAAALIQRRGITLSIGHTDASYDDMMKAYKYGCKRVTHFPNGMNTLHHRDPGCVGAVFSEDFSVEMIIDGVHSLPSFVKMVFRIKGSERIMIVTDTISAAGMYDGEYELGGLKVILKDGRPTLEDGTIAATVVLFSEAVRNFKTFTDCSHKDLARVSSYNALRSISIEDRGRIAPGYIADFVILDRELGIVETVLAVKTVYKK